MNQDVIKIMCTVAKIAGIFVFALVCVLLLGKSPKIKSSSKSYSHSAKLQRNKFAYMNKHS